MFYSEILDVYLLSKISKVQAFPDIISGSPYFTSPYGKNLTTETTDIEIKFCCSLSTLSLSWMVLPDQFVARKRHRKGYIFILYRLLKNYLMMPRSTLWKCCLLLGHKWLCST